MIAGFTVLLICQLAGEAAARGLGLALPGPVLGLIFLVAALAVSARLTGDDRAAAGTGPLGRVADGLLASLALLFVPAGVGVVQYLGLIGAQGVAIVAALVVSTLLTLLATVGTFLAIRRALGTVDAEDGR